MVAERGAQPCAYRCFEIVRAQRGWESSGSGTGLLNVVKSPAPERREVKDGESVHHITWVRSVDIVRASRWRRDHQSAYVKASSVSYPKLPGKPAQVFCPRSVYRLHIHEQV